MFRALSFLHSQDALLFLTLTVDDLFEPSSPSFSTSEMWNMIEVHFYIRGSKIAYKSRVRKLDRFRWNIRIIQVEKWHLGILVSFFCGSKGFHRVSAKRYIQSLVDFEDLKNHNKSVQRLRGISRKFVWILIPFDNLGFSDRHIENLYLELERFFKFFRYTLLYVQSCGSCKL